MHIYIKFAMQICINILSEIIVSHPNGEQDYGHVTCVFCRCEPSMGKFKATVAAHLSYGYLYFHQIWTGQPFKQRTVLPKVGHMAAQLSQKAKLKSHKNQTKVNHHRIPKQ